MTAKSDPVSLLQKNRLLRSPEEVDLFEKALAAAAVECKLDSLPDLHLVLDDKCCHYEVMFGLVHLIESFEVELQLTVFLDVLPQLSHQAPDWCRILFFRILNDEVARGLLRGLLQRRTDQSEVVARNILEQIATDEKAPLKDLAGFVLSSSTTSAGLIEDENGTEK